MNEQRSDLRDRQIDALHGANRNHQGEYSSLEAGVQGLEGSYMSLAQQVDDQKLQREREEYLDSSAANSHAAGAAVGTVSGFVGGTVASAITTSLVTLPIIGLPVGVAAGVAVQNLTKNSLDKPCRMI